jgi:ribosomal protein S18 acetylase RimI-like enzyme
MDNIQIVKASPTSTVGGQLNSMALGHMAYPMIGSTQTALIEKTLKNLWSKGSNRFSHQYAFEAQMNHKTIGIITCYPVPVMNRLSWPTFLQLMELRKWGLISHSLRSLRNIKEVVSMISLNEGREGEYHIGTLATLPQSRGYGVGSKLIHFAEEQAKLNDYQKTSLTVKKDNTNALRLYEKLGYVIKDSIEKPPYSLYRMVKVLSY